MKYVSYPAYRIEKVLAKVTVEHGSEVGIRGGFCYDAWVRGETVGCHHINSSSNRRCQGHVMHERTDHI